jgi:hypothetical protein
MTPKEKAKELVDNFSNFTIQESWQSKNYFAIECALIAVKEIIKFGNQAGIREPMMYWNKVEQEIENL